MQTINKVTNKNDGKISEHNNYNLFGFYISNFGALKIMHSKMMIESVKKSLEKSKNVLEGKRKIVKRRICIKKTHTFTIIVMNFVQEQLIRFSNWTLK